MKVRCKWAMCATMLDPQNRYCPKHKPKAESKFKMYSAQYDLNRQLYDGQYRAFYQSKEWRAFRLQILNEKPICNRCVNFANELHHIIPLKQNWTKRLLKENIEQLCKKCHSRLELDKRLKEQRKNNN